MLSSKLKDNIDILMIFRAKLDSSFSQTQFRIVRYDPPFKYDKTSDGDGIHLFIKENILAKIISIKKGIFVKLNFYYVVPITLIGILPQVIWIFLEKYWIRKFSY